MANSYASKLKKLQTQRRKVFDSFEVEISNARFDKRPEKEIYLIRDNQNWELRDFDGQIAALQTSHFLELAERYAIPTGHLEWEEDEIYGHRHLTLSAASKLKEEISAARKERWDTKARWLPVLSAITGVLGAAIGVLSFLYKH